MDESLSPSAHDPIARRVCGEFLEMPGLTLTHAQACRLWGLDPQTCSRVLNLLTVEGFLHRGRDGRYAAVRARSA